MNFEENNHNLQFILKKDFVVYANWKLIYLKATRKQLTPIWWLFSPFLQIFVNLYSYRSDLRQSYVWNNQIENQTHPIKTIVELIEVNPRIAKLHPAIIVLLANDDDGHL